MREDPGDGRICEGTVCVGCCDIVSSFLLNFFRGELEEFLCIDGCGFKDGENVRMEVSTAK